MIANSGNYLQVINHRNFNPRLIEFVTDAQRFDGDDADAYWKYLVGTLNNPAAVWEHVYQSQLDDHSRLLLLLCCYNGTSLSEPELRNSFARFKSQPVARGYSGNSEFMRNARLVAGCVLNRSTAPNQVARYDLFNPSVADYVFGRVGEDADLLTAIFASLDTASSLRTLAGQIKQRLISEQDATKVTATLLLGKMGEGELAIDYRILLVQLGCAHCASFASVRQIIKEALPSLLAEVTNEFSKWEILGHALAAGLELDLVPISRMPALFETMSHCVINYDEADAMCDVYRELPPATQSTVLAHLKKSVMDVWEDSIQEVAAQSGVFDEFMSEDDSEDAAQRAESFLEKTLDEYPFAFSRKEIESLLERIDISDIIYGNHKRATRYPGNQAVSATPSASASGAIDDLFSIDLPED
jgi:hypothetical protein